MRVAFMGVALLLSTAVHAQTLGFKGVPIGAERAALLAAFPGLECRRPSVAYRAQGEEVCGTAAPAGALATYANRPVRGISFALIAGRLEGFNLLLSWAEYGAVRDALATEYGAGAEITQPLQTAGGRAIASRVWQAVTPEGTAALFERGGGIDQALLDVSSPALRQWARSARAGKPDL